MGIYDRDYYRDSPKSSFGALAIASVTTWLIVANVVIFVADGLIQRAGQPDLEELRDVSESHDVGRMYSMMMGPIQRWGYFSVQKAVFEGQVWRFITYEFLHSSPGHLIMNMLALWFFGPIVEGHFGARRYIAFYISCGFAGALAYVILWACRILIGSADIPMVGASGCIFGVLVACAKIAPEMEVTLWFPPIPIRIGVLVWIAMAMAIYTIFMSGFNAGGEAAHLGGGLWGFALIMNQHWLNAVVPGKTMRTVRTRRGRMVQAKDWSKDLNR